jgi:hypothetical protein
MLGRFRSSVDREAAYEIKTKPDRVKQVSDDIRARALQRHSEKQELLATFELQAKDMIDKTGVSTPLYVAYLNYCREIWKKWNTYSGKVLLKETDAVIAKWKARDLDEEILKSLRFDLITVKDEA